MGDDSEFEFDGVIYVAVETDGFSCDGCELFGVCHKIEFIECLSNRSLGGQPAIFVEKQQ